MLTFRGVRYLSQVRQELAMRLLARLYADGPAPSKVGSHFLFSFESVLFTHWIVVVAELYEKEVYGEIALRMAEKECMIHDSMTK